MSRVCPSCGREIPSFDADDKIFWCPCGVTISIEPDEETPVSIFDDDLRADWYRAGEGHNGDYNPENPDDEELLRFDIYRKMGDWQEVEDASYCTLVPADTSLEKLIDLLYCIFKEYRAVDLDSSVKKLGEALSWIGSGEELA